MKCGERVQMTEPQMKKMKPNWKVSSILDSSLSEEPKSIRAVVATVREKKDLAQCMQEISRVLPVPEFAHLKRIRGCDVILSSTDGFPEFTDEVNVGAYLVEKGLSGTLVEKLSEIRQENVPKNAPVLRWQYEMASKCWPCKFHPDKYLESLYNNQNFSSQQINFHISIMEMCLKLSDKHKNPAIVVDPRDSKIVTVAWSQVDKHPLQHSAMVAVDNVARSQEGGAWETDVVSQALEGIRQEIQGLSCDGGNCGNLDKYGPYLCTGYDVYLLEEPCLMCSMALVHSRVRRVFFQRQSPENGALMSIVQLHTVKELNHHYQVFRID